MKSPRSGDPHAYYASRLPARIRALTAELAIPPGGRVLDYGCADMPYRSFFPASVEFVGADLARNQQATIVLNPDGTLPVGDGVFDAVLSTQVLEHVDDPARYLHEALRVLRPGGQLLLSTHGIFFYHPDPVDLWRWTSEGLRREVQKAGFEILVFEGIVGLAATGLQLLQDAVSFRLSPRWVPRMARLMQPIVAFADRFETPRSLSYNAAVFALVGQKPT